MKHIITALGLSFSTITLCSEQKTFQDLPLEVAAVGIGQYLTQKDTTQLAKVSKSNQKIAKLAMRKLDLTGKTAPQVNNALEGYAGPQLRELKVIIPQKAVDNFRWDLLKKCTGLEKLSLKYSELSELPDALGSLANLKQLDLSNNLLGQERNKTNLEVLQKLNELQALDLSENYLRHLDLNVLNSVPKLRTVNLSNAITTQAQRAQLTIQTIIS